MATKATVTSHGYDNQLSDDVLRYSDGTVRTFGEIARDLASEVSARWPQLDDGTGDLLTIAREAIKGDHAATADDVAAIVREAREEATAED